MNLLEYLDNPDPVDASIDVDTLLDKLRIEVAQTGAMALRLLQEF